MDPTAPGMRVFPEERDPEMLGYIAAIIFAIAFVISATSTSTNALFAPGTLVAAGLTCLALHISGVGTAWSVPSGRRR